MLALGGLIGCERSPLESSGAGGQTASQDAGRAGAAGVLGGSGGATSSTGGHSAAGGSTGAFGAGGGSGGYDAGAADHLGADADASVAPDVAGPHDAAAGDVSTGGSLTISFPMGSSVAYQVDVAHTGNQPASALTPPLTQAWAVDLGGPVSYPLIVDGRVFVTVGNSNTYGTKIEALDLATGTVIWGPIAVGGTYFWSNAAYDAGRVYVVNFDGLLTAFDAVTGATLWAQQMPGQYAFSSPPTAAGGMVFVGGAGSGGTVYGVDGATGHVLWTASVENGDDSSPVVSADAVYVNYACVQDYALAPLTGSLLWHHSGGCEGGGGDTAVLYQGRLWSRDLPTGNLILDANTGDLVAAFSANSIPAFAGTRGFFLVGGDLQSLEVDTRSVLWTFSPGVDLVSSPLVVNGLVYVGSSTGQIYAVDPVTGMAVWSDTLVWGISPSDEFNVSQPVAGLGAGGDSLIVPAGNHVVCYR